MMPRGVQRDRAATPAAPKFKVKFATARKGVIQPDLEIGLPACPIAALVHQCMLLGSVQSFGPAFDGKRIGESQGRAVRHFHIAVAAAIETKGLSHNSRVKANPRSEEHTSELQSL